MEESLTLLFSTGSSTQPKYEPRASTLCMVCSEIKSENSKHMHITWSLEQYSLGMAEQRSQC